MLSNKEEYEKYMQMLNQQTALQQNSIMNSKMFGSGGYVGNGVAGSNMSQNYQRSNPLNGADLNAYSAAEIAEMMNVLNQVYEQKTLDTPLWSPTKRQLNKHESLKNAYEELMVIKKLVGI